MIFVDQSESLQKLLNSRQEPIDVTQEEDILFKIIIAHNYMKIFNILMAYYKDNYLQKDKHSFDYRLANYKLTEIIQEAIESIIFQMR